jgi:hypothetical protein
MSYPSPSYISNDGTYVYFITSISKVLITYFLLPEYLKYSVEACGMEQS